MKSFVGTFARMEKKYILDRDAMRRFLETAGDRFVDDLYPRSTINSIYFDTPDDRLILHSLEHPYYKDKIRLRTYTGSVNGETTAFAEVKKKVGGKVYKRRISGTYGPLFRWMQGNGPAPEDSQIARELEYLRDYYGAKVPAMQIAYNRASYLAADDPSLRITFDTDVIWRNWGLEENGDAYGFRLLDEDCILMEVKISGNTVPLWLVRIIEDHNIAPSSVSKYGQAFISSAGKADVNMERIIWKERKYYHG